MGLVENNLVQCRAAVEDVTDRDAIVSTLRRLDGAIALTGGDITPAVARTRETLAQLITTLEQR